jgi:hypothetical protein
MQVGYMWKPTNHKGWITFIQDELCFRVVPFPCLKKSGFSRVQHASRMHGNQPQIVLIYHIWFGMNFCFRVVLLPLFEKCFKVGLNMQRYDIETNKTTN